MKYNIFWVLIFCCLTVAVAAPIYRGLNQSGVVTFSDAPIHGLEKERQIQLHGDFSVVAQEGHPSVSPLTVTTLPTSPTTLLQKQLHQTEYLLQLAKTNYTHYPSVNLQDDAYRKEFLRQLSAYRQQLQQRLQRTDTSQAQDAMETLPLSKAAVTKLKQYFPSK